MYSQIRQYKRNKSLICLFHYEKYRVVSTGKGQFIDDFLLFLHREGYAEECYFSFSFSPIFKADGPADGVFTAAQETTQRVLTARRLKTLEDLGNKTTGSPRSYFLIFLKKRKNKNNISDSNRCKIN